MQLRARRPALVLGTMVALLTPIYGCDNAVAPDPQTPGSTFSIDPALQPEVVDTRLAFRDMEHLEGYVKAISEADAGELARTEEQLGEFQSLRAYLDPNEWTEETARAAEGDEGPTGNEAAALEADGVVRGDFPVSDAFLSILNHRGEIQVENTVFKVTRDHVYEVKTEEAGLLEQVKTLSSPAPAEDDPRLIVRKVETTEVTDGAVSSQQADGISAAMLGACHAYAGNYRMRGTTAISNYFFYAEARVTTRWQRKKGWWIFSWWADTWQSGTLRHEYWGNLYYGAWGGPLFGPVPVSGGLSGTGTAVITNVPMWIVGWGVQMGGSLNARHSVSNWALNATCGT